MSTDTRFRSALGADFTHYLELKRALGRKYRGEEQTLRQLDGFLVRRSPGASDLSVAILEDWLTKGCHVTARSRATILVRVRQFCLYRRRTDAGAFVPDRRLHRTLWPHHVTRRTPVILTRTEVRGLLKAALEMPDSSKAREVSRTIFLVLLLLYTTGLRRSEALHLRIGDVDLNAGTLLIRETKFFKTRLVPIAADVLARLRERVERRTVPQSGRRTAEGPLFQIRGKPVSAGRVSAVFTKLLRAHGLKPLSGSGGCRLHDLRATFAVHRIERWYSEGADVQNRLPSLATYMGHKDIVSTQYYVTVTAALLEHASRRFERACAPARER